MNFLKKITPVNEIVPEIKKEVFEIVERPYALRNELKLKSRKIHSVKCGIDTASFVGARVWNSLPSDFKECKLLELFESK